MFRHSTRALAGASPLIAALIAANGPQASPSWRAPASSDENSTSSSFSARVASFAQSISSLNSSSMLHCEASQSDNKLGHPESIDEVDAGSADDADGGDVAIDSDNPGDFEHRLDDKSFNVAQADGVMLMIQSSIGNPGRDSAAVAAQMSLSSGGVNSVYIISDQKAPGLQAVVQPGPDGGKLIKVGVNGKPEALPGVHLDGEALLTASGVHQLKGSSKYNGDDFFASLSLVPMGQGPPNAEFNYHQTVAPGWTAGGSMAAAFSSLFPLPSVQRIIWGTYGSWTDPRRRDKALYWRFGAQPRPDGSEVLGLALQHWHRVNKGLELGANVNVNALSGGGPGWLPFPVPAALADATAGVGGRMTFDGPGGLNPVLMAHLTSNGVASLQWQKPYASGMTNTFMRTTLSAVLDHPKRDYKWGVQLELYY